ncbi:MAG: PAS domain S-box protein [Planctomycetota bacterium]|jgi:PAS domain S-box-containing protein
MMNKQHHDEATAGRRRKALRRNSPMVLIVLVGTLLGLAIYGVTRGAERRRIRDRFRSYAQERIDVLYAHVASRTVSLEALGAFFLGSESVERHEFRTFADVLLEREPERASLGLALRVPQGQREAYEASVRRQGRERAAIVPWSDVGQISPPDRQGDYFAVHFREPDTFDSIPLGLDLASKPTCFEAISRAGDSGLLTTSGSIQISPDGEPHVAVLTVLPIYEKGRPIGTVEERRASLTGMVFEVLVVNDVIAHAVAPFPLEGVDLAVFDRSAPAGKQFLGYHASRLGDPLPDAITAREADRWPEGLHRRKVLDVNGRQWEIVCRPAPALIEKALTSLPEWLLLAAWLLTGLLAAYVRMIASHGVRHEALALQLSQAKDRWERTFDSVPDLIVMIDNQYKIQRVNKAMAGRLGLTPAECVGKTCYEVVHGTDEPPSFCPHAQVLADGREQEAELHDPKFGGDFMVSVSPIKDEEGQITGSVHVARDISERLRTEQALKFQAAILDQIADRVTAVDFDGRITYVNAAVSSLAPGDYVGRTIPDAFRLSPEEEAQEKQIFQRTLEEGEWDGEVSHVGPNGAPQTIHLRSRVIYDEHGEPIGLVGLGTDVTARLQAENALRESETGLRQAQQLAHVGSWEWALEDNSFDLSDELRDIYGLSPEQIFHDVRDLVNTVLHPDDREEVLARIQAIMGGQQRPPGHTEFRVVRPDGEVRWVVATHPVPRRTDVEGNPLVMMGTVLDITERKLVEQALRTSEKRYRQLVENLNEGIVAMDRDGRITFVNTALAEIIGDPAEFLTGRDFFGSTNDAQRDAFRQEFLDPQRPRATPYQVKFLRRDGKLVYLSMRSSPIIDDEGGHIGALAIISDITKRRQAEESLKAAHRRLMFASERERRSLARELHDSLGQQTVAMDLMIANLLSKAEATDASFAGGLSSISQTCKSLANEIRAVCHELYPPALETLGLYAAFRHLLETFLGLVDTDVTCEPRLTDLRLPADVEIAIFRIAQEAVGNALRHSQASLITIDLGRQDSDIILTVCDDGIGFDIHEAEATGLGLRTMHERAIAVGGDLEITSEPGQTRVTATVPEAIPPGK